MEAIWAVRADAAFEALLGLAVLVCAAVGILGPGDFPTPVGRPLLLAVGVLLLALGWAISRGALAPRALAVGNALAAALGVAWLSLASGFSAGGAAITVVTVAALLLLTGLQARL
jgi:hypothetical protein